MNLGQQVKGAPGLGVERGNYRQIVVKSDEEQFEAIRAKALRDRTSLAEAIRTLLEWGLEAEAEGAA